MIYLLPLVLCCLSTPIIFSYWWAHLLMAIFCVFFIKKVARYYLFWIFLAIVLLFSSELRLSLETYLIVSSLIGFSLSSFWTEQSFKTKRNIFLISFIAFFFIDYLNHNWVEKGSALMLLPVYLALFFPLNKLDFQINKKSLTQLFTYMVSFLAVLFSNKRTTLFAFLASLKNLFSKTALILISVLVIASSFFIKDNVGNFYRKSIAPRALIWQAAFEGFLEKPIFGHGFGTFAIDFPPYRFKDADTIGAKDTEYVVHGHNQFFHTLFESGIFGGLLFFVLLVLIYRYANNAFLPFLFMSFFNVSIQSYTQIFLLALMLNPLESKELVLFKKIEAGKILSNLKLIIMLLTAVLLFVSCLGHYFYDHNQISRAIKVDPYHPLYHFTRGAKKINKDIEQSKKDFARAVELAPSIGYFHGFYAAALLGTADLKNAKFHIAKSLKQMGDDPYLLTLSYFINQDNKELADAHYKKALDLNPDIETLLHDPSYTADEFIGVNNSNPRIMSFHRKGKKIFLPLPYIGVE